MDPISVLNRIFTTPESLEKVQEVQDHLELCESFLEFQLAEALSLNEQEADARERALAAPQQLAKTLEQVKEMQAVGERTRQQVYDMTKEINKLDKTKDNLVQSVTILKRLQMLSKVYSQLEILVKNREYKELSTAVLVASELMDYFRPFRSLPQVAELSQQISTIQTHIYDQIKQDFREAVQGKPDLSQGGLSYACEALDSINQDARAQLVDWYCTTMLKEYRELFKVGEEAGSFDNVGRRYAYLKKVFYSHENNETHFPESWSVGVQLANRACSDTRKDLDVLLKQFSANASGAEQIQLLLNTLNETFEFEHYLGRKFGSEFKADLSTAFLPYLSVWVDYQDRQLGQKLREFRSPQPIDPSDNVEVIPSSADLFIYYRQALAQMVKMSTGAPLLRLSRVFARWLSVYSSSILSNYLPGSISQEEEDVAAVGLVLHTADYCMSTTDQLEQTIFEQLDESLQDNLSFDESRDALFAIVNRCVDLFVNYVEFLAEPSWREMANMNWGRLTSAGDQSIYVSHLCATVKKGVQIALKSVSKLSTARLICDRVVESVTIGYLTAAMRTKPVSEVAAEQMLLDLYTLKGTLLELLSLWPQHAEANQEKIESYRHATTKTVGRAESVLQVLHVKPDPIDAFVDNYLVFVGDRSVSNFRKILETKNMRQTSRVMDMFRSKASENPDLSHEAPMLAAVQLTKPISRSRSPATPTEPVVSKLNENFRKFGEFLRRDGQPSPLPRR